MYVIKMKTLIYYFAVFAVIIASVGIIKLYGRAEVTSTEAATVEASEALDEPEGEALASAGKKDKVEVPILMYHSILRSTNTHGNYIITEAAFEADLKFLKDNGYTTVVMQDLIDYVYDGKELPKKPVVLTFDDGYSNNFIYAFPLLEKYNSKAVLSIIGYYTDLYTKTPDENPSYSHVTWDNIKEMKKSGLVEIQNHSYNLHTTDKGRNGTKKKRGESQAEYRAMLTSDLGKLQDQFKANVGYTPTTFTYPFGSVSNASFDIIKEMGFKASLSCESGMNTVSRDPECLYMMKRYLRTPKKSAESLLK
ncbi:MAG: polysaccharide deacetylase family protein [Clostridia bacterium]|nr:polysaccharide deacetylase family protein [Clostridia bacterium]